MLLSILSGKPKQSYLGTEMIICQIAGIVLGFKAFKCLNVNIRGSIALTSHLLRNKRICGPLQATAQNSHPTTHHLSHLPLHPDWGLCGLPDLEDWCLCDVPGCSAAGVVAASLSDNLLRSTAASQPSKPRGEGRTKQTKLEEKMKNSKLHN